MNEQDRDALLAKMAQRVDELDAHFHKLELIESHLLDLLIPQRKAFMRTPVEEPKVTIFPPVVPAPPPAKPQDNLPKVKPIINKKK